MIIATNVSKRFGELVANDSISFNCRPGQITGLLGANGAGKSTLLKSLVGLTKPTSGELQIDQLRVAENPIAVKEKIGVVLGLEGLYQHLSGYQQIELAAQLQGVDDLPYAVDRICKQLQLNDFIHRSPSTYSTGQRMRTCLAKAIVHRPKYLVLDEPTRGLDVLAIAHLRQILSMLRDEGCCILLSSHVMQEIESICDSILVIDSGKLVFDGEPQQFLKQRGEATLEAAFLAQIKEQAA